MSKKQKSHQAEVPEHAAPAAAAAEHVVAEPPKNKHDKKLVVLGDYTPDSKLEWLVTKNPRSAGRATFDRFQAYMGSPTVAAYMASGGTKGDLLWDLRAGYIAIEGVALSGDISLRQKKAPPVRAKKEKLAPAEKSAEATDLDRVTVEETID